MSAENKVQAQDRKKPAPKIVQPQPSALELQSSPEPLPLLVQRATLDPDSISPPDANRLQRTIGNQSVGRMAQSNQANTPNLAQISLQSILNHATNINVRPKLITGLDSRQELLADKLIPIGQQSQLDSTMSQSTGIKITQHNASQIQRRVPKEVLELAQSKNPSVVKKLRKTIKRTVQDQPGAVKLKLQDVFKTANLENFIDAAKGETLSFLITVMEKEVKELQDFDVKISELLVELGEDKALEAAKSRAKHSAVNYPGVESTFVPWKQALKDKPARDRFQKLIGDAQQYLIDSGKDDSALKRVFGEEAVNGKPNYQWAKPVFTDAASALGRLLNSNMIGADLSGEGTEMQFGGLTSTSRMLLKRSIFDDMNAGKAVDPKDHLITVCHESFHAAYAEIQDVGGYRHEDSFVGRSPEEKLKSAPHFEEVVWQVKLGADKRKLTPIDKGGGGAGGGLDAVGKANKEATDFLRNAWVQALRNHGYLKDNKKTQMGYEKAFIRAGKDISDEEQAKLTFLSNLEGWTLHKRLKEKPGIIGYYYPHISDLDLTLSEGVTKRVAQAYGSEMPKLPKTLGAWGQPLPLGDEDAVKKQIVQNLVRQALTIVGPIRKSLARDEKMLEILNDIYNGKINPASAKPDKLPK